MELIMNDQQVISSAKNEERVGLKTTAIVEGYDDYIRCYFGRCEFDAPEIDGKIFFMSDRPLKIGDFVKVQINDCLEYDLLGEVAQ